MKLSCS